MTNERERGREAKDALRPSGDPRYVRIPPEVVERVEAFREEYQRTSGAEMTYAQAIRTLIKKGLDA